MGLSPGCNPKDPGIAGMFDVTDVGDVGEPVPSKIPKVRQNYSDHRAAPHSGIA